MPKIRHQGNVRNFDKMFTDMPISSSLGKDQVLNPSTSMKNIN